MATNANFTGTAYLQMLLAADSLITTSVGNVTLEAGAGTKWHSHPAGQILLVTNGTGYYQEKGQPKKNPLQWRCHQMCAECHSLAWRLRKVGLIACSRDR